MYISIYVLRILLFYLVESTNKEVCIAVVLCVCNRLNKCMQNKLEETTFKNFNLKICILYTTMLFLFYVTITEKKSKMQFYFVF